MVEVRKYFGIFQFFGGFILVYSILFPAAIYGPNGSSYLELMIWGWMYRRGIWSFGISWGFIRDPLVMGLSIIFTIGLVTSGFLMIFSGFFYIKKLIIKKLPTTKKFKLLWLGIGFLLIFLPIVWMFGVESFFYTVDVSFLRNLKPSGPVITSFIIGSLNIVTAILTPLE